MSDPAANPIQPNVYVTDPVLQYSVSPLFSTVRSSDQPKLDWTDPLADHDDGSEHNLTQQQFDAGIVGLLPNLQSSGLVTITSAISGGTFTALIDGVAFQEQTQQSELRSTRQIAFNVVNQINTAFRYTQSYVLSGSTFQVQSLHPNLTISGATPLVKVARITMFGNLPHAGDFVTIKVNQFYINTPFDGSEQSPSDVLTKIYGALQNSVIVKRSFCNIFNWIVGGQDDYLVIEPEGDYIINTLLLSNHGQVQVQMQPMCQPSGVIFTVS